MIFFLLITHTDSTQASVLNSTSVLGTRPVSGLLHAEARFTPGDRTKIKTARFQPTPQLIDGALGQLGVSMQLHPCSPDLVALPLRAFTLVLSKARAHRQLKAVGI